MTAGKNHSFNQQDLEHEREVAQSCLTLCDPMDCSRQEYWSGLPFHSLENLRNPGTEPGSPALQADALLSEPPGKPRRASVSKLMSLLFNMLSRLVIAFLPRNKHLLISWLQLPSSVTLEPPKRKSLTEVDVT